MDLSLLLDPNHDFVGVGRIRGIKSEYKLPLVIVQLIVHWIDVRLLVFILTHCHFEETRRLALVRSAIVDGLRWLDDWFGLLLVLLFRRHVIKIVEIRELLLGIDHDA